MAKDSPYIHAMFIKICLYIYHFFFLNIHFSIHQLPQKIVWRTIFNMKPNNYMCNLYLYIEIHNRHNHEIQLQAATPLSGAIR